MDGLQQRILRYQVLKRNTPPGSTSSKLPPWLASFLAEKPVDARYPRGWGWEKCVMLVGGARTGATTAVVVRPFVEQVLHLEGNFFFSLFSNFFSNFFGIFFFRIFRLLLPL